MWGQADLLWNVELPLRIIPTRVGTSLQALRILYTNEDHPHACGDKLSVKLKLLSLPGSSPRVWGQADFTKHRTTQRRIIPTRVGTRKKSTKQALKMQDHPHACGDKKGTPRQIHTSEGSSPRVWGQGLT